MAEPEYNLEFLTGIREKLREEWQKIDPKDISLYDDQEYQRFSSDDEYFRRYVKRKKGDVNATIPFLLDVLKWKKRLNLSDLTEGSFPKEFYEFGGIHVYGSDKDNNVVLHIRISLFQKIPEIIELLKKFTIFQMLKADEEAAKRGPDVDWVLLFDCTGAGIANADMEMANFVNSTLKNYFPFGQKYVLAHNLPWLLNAIKNVIFTLLPSNVKKRIKFTNGKAIQEYIPTENLPPYMGGTCPLPYPTVPKDAMVTSEMVKEGLIALSADEEIRVKKYYDKIYLELKKSQTVVEAKTNGENGHSASPTQAPLPVAVGAK